MNRLVSFVFVLVLAVDAHGKFCTHLNKNYPIGSSWVSGSSICECLSSLKVNCHKRLGKCDAWGDPHFTSFDGKTFDFQGTCRYVLTRDCCDGSFSIEVEQKEYSKTTAVTDKFTIRFGSRVVKLEKVQVLEIDGIAYPGLFYDDPMLRCEMVFGFMMVTLKDQDVWFRWNYRYHVQVYVHPKYADKLCGLCANFDGVSGNDLSLTPTGEPASSILEWGESWRTRQQPKRCNGTNGLNNNGEIECVKDPQYAPFLSACKTVLYDLEFQKCHAKIPVANYVKNCRAEMCECAKMHRNGCLCVAVSAYIQACIDSGVAISHTWKRTYGCGVCNDRLTRQVYAHGDSWRTGCKVFKCNNGAVESQKSPDKNCCTFKNIVYMSGQSWRYGCIIYTCEDGKTSIKSLPGCCNYGGQIYHTGQSRVHRCVQMVCRDGKVYRFRLKGCCYDTDLKKIFKSGSSWRYRCETRTCIDRNIFKQALRDCCYHKGRSYLLGEGYTDNRCKYVCHGFMKGAVWNSLLVLCPKGWKNEGCTCRPNLVPQVSYKKKSV